MGPQMPKRKVRASLGSLTVAVALVMTGDAGAGQNAPNFGGILGVILNSALANQVRQEWQSQPAADLSCLEAHNVSADQLAESGVGPNDPRVQRMFAQCARESASEVPEASALAAPTSLFRPNFIVEGLAVGGRSILRAPHTRHTSVIRATSSWVSLGARLATR
jgi:hypothetical protein